MGGGAGDQQLSQAHWRGRDKERHVARMQGGSEVERIRWTSSALLPLAVDVFDSHIPSCAVRSGLGPRYPYPTIKS